MARSVKKVAASRSHAERDTIRQISSMRFTPLRPRATLQLLARRQLADKGAFSPIQLPPRTHA